MRLVCHLACEHQGPRITFTNYPRSVHVRPAILQLELVLAKADVAQRLLRVGVEPVFSWLPSLPLLLSHHLSIQFRSPFSGMPAGCCDFSQLATFPLP